MSFEEIVYGRTDARSMDYGQNVITKAHLVMHYVAGELKTSNFEEIRLIILSTISADEYEYYNLQCWVKSVIAIL